MIQSCIHCGIAFDLDNVPRNPFKRCPNPSCRSPLDADAVEHTYTEAHNPGNTKDAARLDLRAQLHNDVAAHDGTDTKTMQEKIAEGIAPNGDVTRKIERNTGTHSAAARVFRAANTLRAPSAYATSRKPANKPSGFDAFRK